MRKYFLDNIRWGVVVIVLIYHVFYIFNHIGVLGGIGPLGSSIYPDIMMYVVYPWFMVLMFLIAGISARYSLTKRTAKEFLGERVKKLLVPSTLGLFVLHWITGFINLKVGGATEQMPSFMIYPISVMSGIGPLWFIQLLFVFSLLIVLIKKLDKDDKFYNLCKKCNIVIILLFAFLLWGASMILNVPVLTMYRIGIYFTAFLIGYFVFSHDEVLERVEKIRIPMLIFAVAGAIGYTIYYFGQNCCADEVLQSLFTNIYLWIAILAIIGCAKRYLNKTNKFCDYMTKSSFGFYIIHYPVLLIIAYFLYKSTALPTALIYIISLVGEFIFTFLLYEGIKRVPILRFWVLGIKKPKKEKVKA